MKCPSCNGTLGVADSRPRPGVVRRVRKCRSCGNCVITFETFESVFHSLGQLLNVTKPASSTNRRKI
jgi:transcriptional regulator NrdR family protein